MQTVTEDCGVMLQLTEQEIKDFVVDKLQANTNLFQERIMVIKKSVYPKNIDYFRCIQSTV